MRLFVAIWPSPEVVAALRALDRPDVPALRWTSPGRWHVTLAFLGEADAADAVARLRRALGDDVGSTVARVGPATACFGRTVLHVPVSGLEPLARAVRPAYADVVPEGTLFTGHLTLARARGRHGDVRVVAGTSVGGAAGMTWSVGAVELVASVPTGEGPRYETVAAVPLPAGGYPTSNMRSGLQWPEQGTE